MRSNKRDRILEAALRVVETRGANHLTLDGVAAESGFSKGGVLYHFGSKKALLQAMVNHLIAADRRRIAEHADKEHPLAALLHVADRMTDAERRASLALVAAAAENPELMMPAQEHMAELFRQISTAGRDSLTSQLLFLANEGLRFLDILELNPMSKAEVAGIIDHLQKLAQEGSSP